MACIKHLTLSCWKELCSKVHVHWPIETWHDPDRRRCSSKTMLRRWDRWMSPSLERQSVVPANRPWMMTRASSAVSSIVAAFRAAYPIAQQRVLRSFQRRSSPSQLRSHCSIFTGAYNLSKGYSSIVLKPIERGETTGPIF